ncbi:MAG: hypothetical protein LAO55_17875 [Acidobacteriia bacterium]|nr:hypothetical protein [Terriglobia bacterium]
MIAIVLAGCSTMTAQISNYLGPGILSRGAGDIGTRAGQDVDLRFFVNATGIYDNGLQPYSVDGKGQLVTVNGLWGTQVSFGAYGVHTFRHARLGLDYQGAYRHYTEKTFYDGTDHTLALGYTYQKSRRLVFDLRQMAGMITQGASLVGALPLMTDSLVTPASTLFDNRMSYLQSSLDVNFLKSDRTTVTFGGEGFGIWRKATGLIGMQGYMLHGAVTHRVSRRITLGLGYQHSHYDYPKAFGESDINAYYGTWAAQLSRNWTLSLNAGAFQAEVQGLQRVSVDPQIAALLGVTSTVQTFYQKSMFPQGSVKLDRKFRRADLAFGYQRGVSAGNGVYLTSQLERETASFSYTGIRKWSFSAQGGYSQLKGIGQGLQPYSQIIGTARVTYSITSPIHVFVGYDNRHQDIVSTFHQNSFRASVGISFSPGDVPLSFH